MNRQSSLSRLFFLAAFVLLFIGILVPADAQRERIRLDSGWKFNLGDISGVNPYPGNIAITQWKYIIDGNGLADAAAYTPASFDDSSWSNATTGQDVFNGNVTYAWFRTRLDSLIPAGQDAPPHAVTFNSVDDNAWVYLNGHLITTHQGWNLSFVVQLDAYWVAGGPNELAVLVQNTGGPGGIESAATLSIGSSPSLPIGTTSYDDSSWTTVHLPHDYVDQGVFTSSAANDHGSLPVTPAWYRKSFTVDAAYSGRDIWLDFDGIYRNAVVYVNGHCVGIHPSGYIGVHYDIAQYINFGGANEIAVHVDPTFFEGWFYEGGGIYRHVWLNIASPIHVAPSGTYVTSTLSGTSSTENIVTTVVNTTASTQTVAIQSTIFDPSGAQVATTETSASLPPNSSTGIPQSVAVANAQLWSLNNPALYSLNTVALVNGTPVDTVNTNFGIRTIQFTISGGFYLNGQRVQLQGTCNHQDFIGVGSGMPDSVLYYRLRQLKAMGCNAYRCSHNPTAPELLDYCDKLGILVMDENRHLGDTYAPKTVSGTPYSSLQDLKDMIVRDRNHPSIILWSLCNEEWNMQGTTEGVNMLQAMKTAVQTLDLTRPVTCADNGDFGANGFCSVMDVIGINYNQWVYPYIQTTFPNTPDYASECGSALSTRGVYADDATDCWESAYDVDAPSWGGIDEWTWQQFIAYPFMAGGFFWTGFDYLGEPTPYSWPAVSSQFGAIDRCGFPKDDFYYFQSIWTTAPMVHILPHWNWSSGQTIGVWAYSNCNQVELFLNGVSQGVQSVTPAGHLAWSVPWTSGVLTAKAYNNGVTVATDTVQTAGAPAALRLTPSKTNLIGDGEDLAVVKVEVIDANGIVVPTANNEVAFSVSGSGHLAGVGNGNPSSHELEQGSQRAAFNGLCAALVQSNDGASGTVTLTAASSGLTSASISLPVGSYALPVVSGLNPSTVPAYSAFTLTVNGSNFEPGAQVRFGDTLLTTTFVSSGQLTAAVPLSANWYRSVYPNAYPIAVVNPDGTLSNSVTLAITAPIPAPAISGLSPSSVPAYSAFTLTVNGSNFVSGAQVKFNGILLAATFQSASQLTVAVPLSSNWYRSVYPNSYAIEVVNPNGMVSNTATIAITAPIPPPTISGLSPSSVPAYSAFTLTVNGSNFISGAQVKFNGVLLAATFQSASQLTVAVPLSSNWYRSVYPNSYAIEVVNPGGTVSNVATLAVTSPIPAPAIANISPSSVPAHSAFTLTVNGSNFASGAQIRVGGSLLATGFVSASQLTALVPISVNWYRSVYPNSYAVAVVNPDSTVTNSVTLTIIAP